MGDSVRTDRKRTGIGAASQAPGQPGTEFLRKFFDLGRLPLSYDWKIHPSQRVYCLRNVRMEEVAAIGFDMDYTLAIYEKLAIEELTFKLVLQRLVDAFGCPREICDLDYDPEAVIRGLVIDCKLGNFLKMDRFHNVVSAAHGSRALSDGDRRDLYHKKKIRLGQQRYHSVDTLFGLPEGSVYQNLVDLADGSPGLIEPDYQKLYADMGGALDQVHRDDTLKSRIMKDLEKYVHRDTRLAATLEKYLKGGTKLFVLTNSEWYYTDAVMSFLLDGAIDYMPRWTDYFEWIGVEAGKPGFFLGDRPMEFLSEDEAGPLARSGRLFRRGSVAEFERRLGLGAEEILFVGDHIYGDILRSKKQSGWRTVMIVEELEREIETTVSAQAILNKLNRQQRAVDRRDYQRNLVQMKLSMLEELLQSQKGEAALEEELQHQRRELADLERDIGRLHQGLERLESELENRYNPSWGPLFRSGSEISRFGQQVQSYACLYTSRVSNFLAYPVNKYFQSPRELMPHDV